jgi:predicted small metal-binding protein
VRRISCSDVVAGAACKHVVEAETDRELLEQLRAHMAELHADARFDEEAVRARIAAAPSGD